jgi:hypothetical protein
MATPRHAKVAGRLFCRVLQNPRIGVRPMADKPGGIAY